MRVWSVFHYRSYGAFFLQQNRLHNSYGGFTHYRNYRATFLGIVIKSICNLLVPRALNTCYPTGTEGASNVKATSMGIDVKDLSCKV